MKIFFGHKYNYLILALNYLAYGIILFFFNKTYALSQENSEYHYLQTYELYKNIIYVYLTVFYYCLIIISIYHFFKKEVNISFICYIIIFSFEFWYLNIFLFKLFFN